MAHRKAGGTAKNLRDSNPKYLGIKRGDGQYVGTGEVLVRQRGTRVRAGENVRIGKDHTLYSISSGVVAFSNHRKIGYDGRMKRIPTVRVIPGASQ